MPDADIERALRELERAERALVQLYREFIGRPQCQATSGKIFYVLHFAVGTATGRSEFGNLCDASQRT